MIIRARKQWDVKCPPCKKHMVAGKLMPTVRGTLVGSFALKKRRVCLEIQTEDHGEGEGDHRHVAPSHTLPTSIDELGPTDYAVVRILKPRRHWGLSRDTDDSDDEDHHDGGHDEENGDWVEYRKFDLDDIEPESVLLTKTSVEMQVGRGNSTEVREIKFSTELEAQDFYHGLQQLLQIETDRATLKMKEFQEQSTERTVNRTEIVSTTIVQEDVNLLVEIVSATDLPIADLTSSDPYVIVWLGKTEIHRTQCISKTCDPIWAVDTGSLFILSSRARDFFGTTGLTFILKDYDAVGANEVLGKVTIPQDTLLKARGERVEYPVQVLLESFDAKNAVRMPKLNIRVRPANHEDFVFMKTLFAVQKNKKLGVYADFAFVAPATHSLNRLKRETKHSGADLLVGFIRCPTDWTLSLVLRGRSTFTHPYLILTLQYRVKPRPDPDRDESITKWMTEKQIEEEHVKPSTRWIEIGSGKLGRVYFEILRCDALPNTDTGVLGDMTDAFCNIIYEDAIVNTDVINDEVNPRWMPWSQRAFLFNVYHPSSQILVGVFDLNTLGNKPIGRVSIDITNLSSNTEYLLNYDLHKSVLDDIRPPQGTLTVRIRVDFPDFRQLVLASLSLPPANFVNVAKHDHFRSARFVIHGEENLNKLDMDALKSYGNELSAYRDVVGYIQHAALTVLLWRGHYQINLYRCHFKLPLHSIVAFVMGISLIEDFNLLPSYFFFCIAWFFLATNEQRQRNPSPWHKSATFGGLWFAILTGKTWSSEIVPNNDELQPLIIDDKTAQEEGQKEKESKSKRRAKQMNQTDAYLAQEEEELVDEQNREDGIETTTEGFQLNVLKPILLPIQKVLGQICRTLRIGRSIVTWDESFYAFAIVNVSLVAGTALLFVPWSWLVHWILRVVVWTLLGPWMKLVDIFVVEKLHADDDNLVKRLFHSMEQRSLALLLRKRLILMRKEDALKLRAMKSYMFGKYIARVPRFKDYRFPDVPRSESSASPHEAGYSSVQIVDRKSGQKLVGHMIPTWGDPEDGAILTAKAKTGNTILDRINPMNLLKGRTTS